MLISGQPAKMEVVRPAGSEFAADDAPFGLHGGDDVTQDFVNGVFVEVGHVIERLIIAGGRAVA